jgi:hypothetical protein
MNKGKECTVAFSWESSTCSWFAIRVTRMSYEFGESGNAPRWGLGGLVGNPHMWGRRAHCRPFQMLQPRFDQSGIASFGRSRAVDRRVGYRD